MTAAPNMGLSIELDHVEIDHVYAWVVCMTGSQRILAVFYRKRDDRVLYAQVQRLFRKTEDPTSNEITFELASIDVEDHLDRIHITAKEFATSIGASSPFIYPVDGDVAVALDVFSKDVHGLQPMLH